MPSRRYFRLSFFLFIFLFLFLFFYPFSSFFSLPPSLSIDPLNWLAYHSNSHFQSVFPNFPPLNPTLPLRFFHSLPLSFSNSSSDCLDQWLAHRRLCLALSLPPLPPLHVLWSWVNGSDNTFTLLRAHHASLISPSSPPLSSPPPGHSHHHFADHGELRYSLRSVRASLRFPIAFSLFTIDALPAELAAIGINLGSLAFATRIAAVPRWLARTSLASSSHTPPLTFLHHSQARAAARIPDAQTFSSLAIESMFVFLSQLSDTVLYMNDDCFILRELSRSDLSSTLFGPVFHLQFDLPVHSTNLWQQQPLVHRPLRDVGEWPSLRYSNLLLDHRFGISRRAYPLHVPRVLDIQIAREIARVWKSELLQTIRSVTRSSVPELNLCYMVIWYTIEKHREMLLYSLVVLKLDLNRDGMLDVDEISGFHTLLIAANRTTATTTITKKDEAKIWRDLDSIGLERPRETTYLWTSASGYPGSLLNHGRMCKVEYAMGCVPRTVTEAVRMFKKLAFEERGCGDCVLQLVGAGENVLAGHDEKMGDDDNKVEEEWGEEEVLGGFAKEWQRAEFDEMIDRVVDRVGRRRYAVRNLIRYHYVLGKSKTRFISLRTRADLESRLSVLEDSGDESVYVAVNDDGIGMRGTELEKLEIEKEFSGRLERIVKVRGAGKSEWWEVDGGEN